jgi:cold shock CspA family protein/ribosome-associated translation inhibitor RaiA
VELPLQIAFHNVEPSEAIAKQVRARAAKLETFADRITGCRVVVEAPHQHHRRGNQYQVRINLTLPGGEIVVSREPPGDGGSRNLGVALRDAFDSARRQLEDYVRRQRGAVKAHEAPPHARVARLIPGEGYGFLRTPDGREVYFHRNSVVEGSFEHLQQGAEVVFTEHEGVKGPQASTVRLAGRHTY